MTTLSRADLRRNVSLNLVGYGLPPVAALVAVPVLPAGLGPYRFGAVALAWAMVAVVGVPDLGFGRASNLSPEIRLAQPNILRRRSLVSK